MNSPTIFYTANAGFFLTVNGITLAVDAFPRLADRGFSALSQDHFQTLCQRDDDPCRLPANSPSPIHAVRYVITTHDHPDHYSRRWTEQFLAVHPEARFIGAVNDDRAPKRTGTDSQTSSILLHGEHPTYYLPGITLEFLRLPHEGAEFAHVDNYGCLLTFPASSISASNISTPGNGTSRPWRVLFLGDAKPADPAIADWISGRSVDLALLNFPWIALPKGRRFIEEHLPHTQIAVLHLPYEQDDRNHYCAAARKAAEQSITHGSIHSSIPSSTPNNIHGTTSDDISRITLLTEFGQVLHF